MYHVTATKVALCFGVAVVVEGFSVEVEQGLRTAPRAWQDFNECGACLRARLPAALMAEHAEFVTLYASELADLTFNSKPVINTLTMLAAENAPAAHSIASAIERHIVTARPSAVSPDELH